MTISFYRLSSIVQVTYLLLRYIHLHQLHHIFVALVLNPCFVELIRVSGCKVRGLEFFLFLRSRLLCCVAFDLPTNSLLHKVVHRGTLADVLHVHAHIRVSHRELMAFFAQQSVHLLKPRIIVLFHHEGICPSLNEPHQLLLRGLSSKTLRHLHDFEFKFAYCATCQSQLCQE